MFRAVIPVRRASSSIVIDRRPSPPFGSALVREPATRRSYLRMSHQTMLRFGWVGVFTPSMTPEIPLQHVRLHGHQVGYRIAGDGPLVVLIHGITSRSDVWLDAMASLSERYTVVAPDLLGHGRSAKPRGDYSLGA